jgi:hypothetical protein
MVLPASPAAAPDTKKALRRVTLGIIGMPSSPVGSAAAWPAIGPMCRKLTDQLRLIKCTIHAILGCPAQSVVSPLHSIFSDFIRRPAPQIFLLSLAAFAGFLCIAIDDPNASNGPAQYALMGKLPT